MAESLVQYVRTRRFPRVGWMVVGFLAALLLVPSVALAAGKLKFTGIEGTSLNRADVTPANQLQVAEASPANYYASGVMSLPTGTSSTIVQLVSPPSGRAIIVQTIHTKAYLNDFANLYLEVHSGSCGGPLVSDVDNIQVLNPSLTTPYDPGIAIPNGEVLCGIGANSSGIPVNVSVFGYTVPAASVTAFG